ncbi:MAG TPA: hypothetical protein VNU21_17915 [Usitatibacter sp.]|nr:hypothetical protein [Usitatibacter sp.]
MEPKRDLAEQAAAPSKQICANEVGAISGGGADTPPAQPIASSVPALTPTDSEFAATIVTAYENIVQGTSDFIERVLGPYNSEP